MLLPARPMANPRTIQRLQARILERAAYCIEFELSDPRVGMITLTKVELSNDLGTAKVHYSVLGSEVDRRRAQHVLDDARGFIQRQVGRVLRTRRIPRLSFHYDDSIAYAAELDRKIKEALRHDRDVNPEAHEDLLDRLEDSESPEAEAEIVEDEYEQFLEEDEEENGR